MGVSAAVVGAGALGAAATAYSGNKAAGAQEKSAQEATNAQMSMFDTTQNNLSPYMQAGNAAQATLSSQLPSLTAPITMNEAALQQTPGYQFNLQQGQQSVQNAAAARGLGVSSAALKGASTYATGLADSTYQNQFSNAVTNQTNTYNRLLGAAGLGENAAAGLGNNAVQTGANVGQNITGAGNAAAAGYLTAGNAVGSLGNSVPNALITQQLLQGGLYSGTSGESGNSLNPAAYQVGNGGMPNTFGTGAP